jgi:hypothetical protein
LWVIDNAQRLASTGYPEVPVGDASRTSLICRSRFYLLLVTVALIVVIVIGRHHIDRDRPIDATPTTSPS